MPSARGPRQQYVAVVAAVALLAGVGLVAAVAQRLQDEEPQEILVDARPDSVEGTRMWVQLPTGRLSLTVGEPVSTIPKEEATYFEQISAPPGVAFLPIEPGVRPDGVPLHLDLATRDIQVKPELSLRVGEREYPLGATQDIGLPTYIRVDESTTHTDDLELIVDFDGVTQRVDGNGNRSSGAAAGLYGLPESLPNQDCPRGWSSSPGSRRAGLHVNCYVVAATYPYLSEHGWAHEREPGHTWAIVSTVTTFESATLRRPGGRRSECDPWGPGKGSTELDGEPPVVVLNEFSDTGVVGGVVSQHLAFLVPERDRGELEISRTYRCLSGSGLHSLELARTMPVDLRP